MIDTHTHLEDETIESDFNTLIANFKEAGGHGVLNAGYTPETNIKVIKRVSEFHDPDLEMLISVGLHPILCNPHGYYARPIKSYKQAEAHLTQLERHFSNHHAKISTVGECGLDYYHIAKDNTLTGTEYEQIIEVQKLIFRRHLEIAKEYSKPLTMHIRELPDSTRCIEDALKLIAEVGVGNLHGSFHSYTGAIEFVSDIIGLGFHIGFNAISTYKGSDGVRDILSQIPTDRILLETDAPFLQMRHKDSNQPSQPSDLHEISLILSQHINIQVDEFRKLTSTNASKLFGFKKS